MRVRPKAVRDLAKNAGFPAEVVARYEDEFINLCFVIARRERKHIREMMRGWLFLKPHERPDILAMLKSSDEEPTYDLI